MKFLEKTGKGRNWLKQSPFSSALFCQRDSMYPQYIGPEYAEFSKCLGSSHCYDCLGTQWNSGGVGGGVK